MTADHGEMFGKHGLFGHPPSEYEEELKLPLVLAGPGIPENRTVGSVASLTDLPPNLSELFYVADDAAWEGTSPVPTLTASAPSDDDRSFIIGDEELLACQKIHGDSSGGGKPSTRTIRTAGWNCGRPSVTRWSRSRLSKTSSSHSNRNRLAIWSRQPMKRRLKDQRRRVISNNVLSYWATSKTPLSQGPTRRCPLSSR